MARPCLPWQCPLVANRVISLRGRILSLWGHGGEDAPQSGFMRTCCLPVTATTDFLAPATPKGYAVPQLTYEHLADRINTVQLKGTGRAIRGISIETGWLSDNSACSNTTLSVEFHDNTRLPRVLLIQRCNFRAANSALI